MSDPTVLLKEIIEKHADEEKAAAKVKQLIERGADVRDPMSNGQSMIEYVIEKEAQIQETSPVKVGNCRRVKELLQHDASNLLSEMVLSNNGDINEMKGLTELHASCYQEQKFGPLGLLGKLLSQNENDIRLDVVQFLFGTENDAKLVLTKEDEHQQTCLSLSKSNSKSTADVTNYLQEQLDMLLNKIPFTHPELDVNEVANWIRRGANPEATDELGNTVISNAVCSNNFDLVRILIDNGCDTRHTNKSHKTPLQLAEEAIPRNARLIAILSEQSINNELKELIRKEKSRLKKQDVFDFLQRGANINARVSDNNSFLHYLITCDGTFEMLTAFVNDFNADLLATNNQGRRPIELCILHDKKPFDDFRNFLKLEKVSSDVFFNDISQQSLVDFAIKQNKHECADIIEQELSRRLWVYTTRANTNDDQNQSLFSEVKKLVDYGARIDRLNADDKQYKGWSVLQLACKTTTKSFVEYLVRDLKANCELKNINDDHPISIATEYGQMEIVRFLRECANVQLNVFNKNGDTPLHLAAKKCYYRIVRYLILWGADENAQNSSKLTPLTLAEKAETITKYDNIEKEKTIDLLRSLIFRNIDAASEQSRQPTIPTFDLDTCELIQHYDVNEMRRSSQEARRKNENEWFAFLKRDPNRGLHVAARNGNVLMATQAMNDGADICYLQNQKSPYEVAKSSTAEYIRKANSELINSNERRLFCAMALGCQQIADDLLQLTQTQVEETIKQGKLTRMMAYHDTGIPIKPELLYLACTSFDNVAIVDFLVQKNPNVHEAMYNYPTTDSPYHLAKKKQFSKVASYIKYQLSLDCTEAIKENKLELVKQLVRAGANVDIADTNNLSEALRHGNLELIQILCENGAKIPVEWLESDAMTLKNHIKIEMKPVIALAITRNLIDRKLHLAAASGDFKLLVKCQRLGADINSKSCHGSTALLCAIQHGNYFRIVFSLVSRGATMLHSNENQAASLIELCKQKKYKQIQEYLTMQRDKQFAAAILDNDKQSAAAFEALGADFNYQDIQKRTSLHYAIEYYGKDLVSWLCERGSNPMISDGNGDYPITLAAEKGDFAIVEFFATKYPATKQQKNRAGATALQVAQQQGFKRIAQVLQLKEAYENSWPLDATVVTAPKHSYQALVAACENGQAKIIKEFCDERYDSREKKREICCKLIEAAKKYNQEEIANILQVHHDQNLKKEIPSNIQFDKIVMLNKEYQAILHGLLVGLNTVITGMSVDLDPTDPNTFVHLFSNLNSNVRKRSQEVVNANTDDEIRKLIQKDLNDSNEKLTKIEKQLDEVQKNNQMVMKSVQENDERLNNISDLSAIEKKKIFDEQEIQKNKLAMYECAMTLFLRERENLVKKQKVIKFIKDNSNLSIFYRTIENRLQALFTSVLAAQGGYLQTTYKKSPKLTAAGSAPHVLIEAMDFGRKKIDLLSTYLPAGSLLKPVLFVTDQIVSKLNERQQKKEFYNISTLGNFEELQHAASDTAALLTLYYKQQIESIDTLRKIKGSNIFNDQVYWIKEVFYDVRPESDEEKAVVLVAEYLTACLLDALKNGAHKEIVPTAPLSEQLWLCAAKDNPTGNLTTANDAVGCTAGRQLIPIQIVKSKTRIYEVQLRHFIRYVSLITNEGAIYQYPVSRKDLQDNKYPDLDIFGYVYLAPFTPDRKVADAIIEGRHLVSAKRNARGDILTKFKDIIDLKNIIQVEKIGTESAARSQTAFEVAQMLHDQKTFVDSSYLQAELEKARIKINGEIAVLAADIAEKTKRYQTSIDAAYERIKLELTQAQKMLAEQNEKQFNGALKKLNEQMQETLKQLESFGKHTVAKMQKQLESSNKHQIDQTQKELESYSKKQTLDTQKQLISQNKHQIQEIQTSLESQNELQVQKIQKQLELYSKFQMEQTQKQFETHAKKQILETQKQLESQNKLQMKKYQKQLALQNERQMKEITHHTETELHSAKTARETRVSAFQNTPL